MTFDDLMKQLPAKDSNPFQRAEAKADKNNDDEAGGSKLFKGDKVCDIVICNKCNFSRAIYSMLKINSKQQHLSKRQQKERLEDLESFKESYECGDECTVEGFKTKRTLRCGSMMESQYFTFAKKSTNEWSADICCMCASNEALLSVDEMKENFLKLVAKLLFACATFAQIWASCRQQPMQQEVTQIKRHKKRWRRSVQRLV